MEVSVVITSYNRSRMLRATLASLLAQQAQGVTFEVIVVDNNSTDDTKEVVASFIDRDTQRIKYLFEPQQGASYGRNRGIRASQSSVLAFTDDDVQVTENWIATIKRAFDEHPDTAYVGGKVLPRWQNEIPKWLTREHWAPLAIQDHGDRPFYVDSARRLCLVGANLAFRRSTLDIIGLFEPDLQRVKDSIGSMEDLEIQLRAWRAGKRGLYLPDLVAVTEVPPERLTKEYHRRWHTGHGHYYARLRLDEMEQSTRPRLFDVPAHLYRQACLASIAWLKNMLVLDYDQAFGYEKQLRFFRGFFSTRRIDRPRRNTL